MIQQICRVLPAALLAGMILLAGCEQSEVERLASGGDDNNVSGKLATLSISLQDVPAYNAPDGETRTTGSSEPLIAEWVAVNSFDATRPVSKSGEADADNKEEGPRIALMELREDSVSGRPATRSVMQAGIYFRLIAFRRSGGGYVFQSVADYTSNGLSAPVLRQGKMKLPVGGTYRFAAYSFNNYNSMGTLSSNYVWGGTPIYIDNLYNDFLTFVSGEQKVTGEDCHLSVAFTHQLCQLTVRIEPTKFDPNTFTNCTGVYIINGGNSSTWAVGQDGIAANMNNSASFNINDNSTATVRLVPFADFRQVAVHFGTLTVGGRPADNLTITSSQSVKLLRGRSYTLTAKLKFKKPGIVVPENDINLLGLGCTPSDRIQLSKLRWAEGNLKSMGNGTVKDYVWTTPTDYGYYYTFYSTYTGNMSNNNTDPCSKLKPDIYGGDWRTPTFGEILMLTRCSDIEWSIVNNVKGKWFMNKAKGLFLPAGGYRTDINPALGSGQTANKDRGERGFYWTSTVYTDDPSKTNNAYCLYFDQYGNRYLVWGKQCGYPVRCVTNDN